MMMAVTYVSNNQDCGNYCYIDHLNVIGKSEKWSPSGVQVRGLKIAAVFAARYYPHMCCNGISKSPVMFPSSFYKALEAPRVRDALCLKAL